MKGLLSILIFLLAAISYAQNNASDSLLLQLRKSGSESQRMNILLALCARNDLNTDTFHRCTNELMAVANNIGSQMQKEWAAYYKAWSYYLDGDNDSSRYVIDKVLKLRGDSEGKEDTVYFKLKFFKAYSFMGERQYAKALDILYPLLSEMEKQGNPIFIAQAMHMIANTRQRLGYVQEAISWDKRALDILPTDASNKNIAGTFYGTLGDSYEKLNHLDSATMYNLKAIEIFEATDDVMNLSVSLEHQASVFIKQQQKEKAWKILSELKKLNEEKRYSENSLAYQLAFIDYYILVKDYDRAIALCNKGLFEKNESQKISILLSYYDRLAACYKATEDNKRYIFILEKIIAAKDSIAVINSAESIAEMQTQYEVQKKENTILRQKYVLTRQNFLLFGSMIFLVLSAVIGWLLFRSYRRREKEKALQLHNAETNKREQAVKDAAENERKRIAADLHDNLGSYAASITANIDLLQHDEKLSQLPFTELKSNVNAMVSQLSDTIWALKKEELLLTNISDRVKVFVNRLQPNYPRIKIEVEEDINHDVKFTPVQAYHLFCIIQEAVNNALKHSYADTIVVILYSNESWKIQIADNGKWFPFNHSDSAKGNGVFNMKERAKEVGYGIIWDTKNGTILTVSPTTN